MFVNSVLHAVSGLEWVLRIAVNSGFNNVTNNQEKNRSMETIFSYQIPEFLGIRIPSGASVRLGANSVAIGCGKHRMEFRPAGGCGSYH